MENNEICEKVKEILSKTFSNEHLDITRDMNIREFQGWDSLEHLKLISEIEKSFGIRLTIGEVVSVQRVEDIICIIEQKYKQ